MPGGKGGTGSQGKKAKGRSHMLCRRCGTRAYHKRRAVCASCGFGNSAKLRTRQIGG